MVIFWSALAAFIWACLSVWFALWLCPRLFKYTPKDDEKEWQ